MSDDDAFDRRLLPPMLLGAILNPVNSSIVAVSLVPIGHAFGAPASQTAWLVSALYLATAIGQPVVGRLVDTYGPRPLYLAGTGLVGIAGVLGALAPSLGVLIAARVLLGFGTCAGYPAAMHLIRSEARRTGRDSPATVLTALAIATQTIAVIGPSLGGLLIGLGGWRLTLAINIPMSIAGLALGALRLPRTATAGDADRGLDAAGIALFAVTLVALLLFLMDIELGHVYLVVAALLGATAFALRERRARRPFIDLHVLSGNAPLLATYGRVLLTNIISYAFLYGYTQWLQDGRNLSASQAGLILLPMFATGIAVSALTGRHPEVRGKLVVGGAVQLVVCALLPLLDGGSPVWTLIGVGIVLGVPQGLNNLANQNALYFQADPRARRLLGRPAAHLRLPRRDLRGRGRRRLLRRARRHRRPAPPVPVPHRRRRGLAGADRRRPLVVKDHHMTDATLDPVTALVVIDLQEGIVAYDTRPHPARAVVERSAALARAFRARGLPVVLVNVAGRPPGRTEEPARALAFTEEWTRLADDLDAQPGDLLITKHTRGAFTNTGLEEQLRERGVTQIVLTGISTSGGVESTARDGHERGFHVAVVTDAVTDTDAGAHEHTLSRVIPRIGRRATATEVLALLA